MAKLTRAQQASIRGALSSLDAALEFLSRPEIVVAKEVTNGWPGRFDYKCNDHAVKLEATAHTSFATTAEWLSPFVKDMGQPLAQLPDAARRLRALLEVQA